MPIEEAFCRILICPATRQGLEKASDFHLAGLNRAIGGHRVRTQGGALVEQPLQEALITKDGARIYPVRDGIPVLLVEESIVMENAGQR